MFSYLEVRGVNNLSGAWAKANETKLDPVFQNWAYSGFWELSLTAWWGRGTQGPGQGNTGTRWEEIWVLVWLCHLAASC